MRALQMIFFQMVCGFAFAQPPKAAVAQKISFNMQPGLWEITAKLDGSSLGIRPLPSESEHCIRTQDTAPAVVLNGIRSVKDCTHRIIRATPEIYRWHDVCGHSSGVSITTVGELAFLGQQAVGSITMSMPLLNSDGTPAVGGKPVSMVLSLQGKRKGECR